MRIAYIDPGLSCRQGHNAAMVEEFDQALVAERGHEVVYHCSADVRARDFADLRGRVSPTFRVDGYARPAAADLFEAARFERIVGAIVGDLNRAPGLADSDLLLMPTAYPLHLQALARRLPTLAGRRVVLGLLLPANFWSEDPAAAHRIGELFAQSVGALAASTELFAYSETGVFRCGEDTLRVATLLPPLARARSAQVRRLADVSVDTSADRPWVLGYFGSPFLGKGIGLLFDAASALAQSGSAPGVELRIRLPEGHEPVCERFNALAPWIDATSRRTDNGAYLQQMAQVDAVCAFYDPQSYATKMSGIVPEAISLGKPLWVSEGCDAITDFLERHAPGSFVSGHYDASTAQAVMSLPRAAWDRAKACARRHAPLVQQLKDMDRYLAVCGVA